MTENRPFSVPLEVRFRDIDAMGHVNNAVMFTYFEEGRKHFFFQHLQTRTAIGFNFILARIGCDYLKPVTLTDRPLLQMWIDDIGTKSFTIAYRLVDRDDAAIVYAEGESVQVCYDYAQKRSIPVPDDLKSVLEGHRR